MDEGRFDNLARTIGGRLPRRRLLGVLAGLTWLGRGGRAAGAECPPERPHICLSADSCVECCVDGHCPPGAVCDANFRCVTGPPPTCAAMGEHCTSAVECCQDGASIRCASNARPGINPCSPKAIKVCCRPPGGSCRATCDCCTGRCSSGVCVCPTGNKPCRGECIPTARCCTHADCTGGRRCRRSDGRCICPIGFKPCGNRCIGVDRCCADRDCPELTTCEGGTCCTRPGRRCDSRGRNTCCGGTRCSSSNATSKNCPGGNSCVFTKGQSGCTDDCQCLADSVCRGGRCCLAPGAFCSKHEECCSRLCNPSKHQCTDRVE